MTVFRKCWQRIPRSCRPTGIVVVLLIAACGRLAALIVFSGHLAEDRDAYWGLATSLSEGRGFASPGSDAPTAFRPPLYPLLLAAIQKLATWLDPVLPSTSIDSAALLLGLLQLLIGVATVYLSYRWMTRLGFQRWAIGGALLVAVDPLLIQYTTFAMTETLFTFLVIWLLYSISLNQNLSPANILERGRQQLMDKTTGGTAVTKSGSLSEIETATTTMRSVYVVGLILGLCALCRPTILAFAGLFGCWIVFLWFNNFRKLFQIALLLILGMTTILSPWMLRNWYVVGKPIATTTHGGYTLLLGNNPVFYEVVVAQPLGTVWDDAPADKVQAVWVKDVIAERLKEIGPSASELERDQWMYDRAVQNIRQSPVMFLKACWLRFLRFWNVVPLKPARTGIREVAAIGIYYSCLLLLFVAGVLRLVIRRAPASLFPALILCLSFTLVHAVYWSNMRMRAPLTPAIAVIALATWDIRQRRHSLS